MTPDGATTDADRQFVRETLSNYVGHRGALLMALLDVQYKLGYIPETTVEDAAEILEYSPPEVWGVLTFYSDFKIGRGAGHFVDVCTDGPCHIGGAQKIWSALESAQTATLSEDGQRFQLRRTSCPRLCSQAPLIAVDMQWRGRMTPDNARAIVADLG
jgi:NADH-quinone oxidoreductase subunit E